MFDSLARLIHAIHDLTSGHAGPAQYSLVIAVLVFVAICVGLAVGGPFIRYAQGPEMIMRIAATLGLTIGGVALISYLWATFIFPPPVPKPIPEVVFRTPQPLPAATALPVVPILAMPSDTPDPTPTPEPTETPYVAPPPTPTPDVRSFFLGDSDDKYDGFILDRRARILGGPLRSVLADAHDGFSRYRQGAGPPYKTWSPFVDFSCKVGEAPPPTYIPPSYSLQCASFRTFFPDAAKDQTDTMIYPLASVMNAGTVFSEADFRDWSDIEVLRFPTAWVYLGQRNFQDGTHVVLEVVPT